MDTNTNNKAGFGFSKLNVWHTHTKGVVVLRAPPWVGMMMVMTHGHGDDSW